MALLSLSVINIKPQIDRSWGRLASLREVGRQINDLGCFFICTIVQLVPQIHQVYVGAVYALTTNARIIDGPFLREN